MAPNPVYRRRMPRPAKKSATEVRTTIKSRVLGEALHDVMVDAGYNGKRIARELAWSEAKVSRLVNGKLAATLDDVSAFLAVCRCTGRRREQLMAIVTNGVTDLGWHQQFGARPPEQLETLIGHEAKATAITEFEGMVLPGLLQTGDYAKAVIAASANVTPADVQGRINARLGRQGIFTRDRPPRFVFYFPDYLLRQQVGGPEVMSDQLHHLLRVSVRPYISVRVVTVAAHPGMAGACRLMESPDFGVVYLEGETTGQFLEDPREISAYRNVFRALDAVALDDRRSRALIDHVARTGAPDPSAALDEDAVDEDTVDQDTVDQDTVDQDTVDEDAVDRAGG